MHREEAEKEKKVIRPVPCSSSSFTLVTGPGRSVSLKLSDTRGYQARTFFLPLLSSLDISDCRGWNGTLQRDGE